MEIAYGSVNSVAGRFKIGDVFDGSTGFHVIDFPAPADAPDWVPRHLIAVWSAEAEESPWGMLFGDDFLIDRPTIIAGYWPDTQELGCFHCMDCAMLAVAWIKEQQDGWGKVFARGSDESTGARPQGLRH